MNTIEKATIFIISKDGTYIEKEFLDLILEILGKSFEPVNAPEMNHVLMKASREKGMPFKNAHNDPAYLLGEIEESEYPVVVVAWYENEEGFPNPKFFVSHNEMHSLVEELDKNRDVDAWETAIRVNKKLREEENKEG